MIAARIAAAALVALAPLGCRAAAASPASPASGHAHPYAAHVTEASQRFGIPEAWIWRVMHTESRGNRRAVSPVGAMGLMQIMPGTWAMLSARHRLGADPFDARMNILAGAAYLRAMWDRYRDVRLMLAAYNAGPGRADAYAAGRRRLPAETRAYVAQIVSSLGVSGVSPAAPARPWDSPNWRDASLFTAQSEREKFAREPGIRLHPAREATAADGPLSDATSPLFVALSGDGQ
ncbi:lytic transglycosylase domain-containing protein [Sphingopyxis sp.]|uniref:lytic transglycosylase domain-containing protein n=1 Tax=Sphingopyxis sp. TaxID=1908224 RepID=UPI002D76FA38|nr:lytic transglycosylase domain-containing protein [Sphingopyxis sp.]HET6523548.1 lytic transglycosylase domain-containing protein [Sphingopyxis sp.]